MFRKIGSILENHIEKIVLLIAGLLCVWLFMRNILLKPNDIEIRIDNKTETVSPGEIDNLIRKEANKLNQEVTSSSQLKVEPYIPRVSDFLAKMDSPLKDISPKFPLQSPADSLNKGRKQLVYDEPDVGVLTNVVVGYIRGAAYVPNTPVANERGYTQSISQIKDIDLVTVEARYDIAALCESLDNFAEQLKDPCMARPVFASVNLQRRQLNNDGTWGNWQNVPRSKVDRNRQSSIIIDNTAELTPAAQKVQMLQLDNKQIQVELLQPISYQFASAKEQWYPPVLHQQYLLALKKEITQERKNPGLGSTPGSTSVTSTGTGRRSSPASSGQYNPTSSTTTTTRSRGNLSGRSTYTPGTTTSTTTSSGRPRRGSTNSDTGTYTDTGIYADTITPTQQVEVDYVKQLLTLSSNFARLKEPVTIWAIDDTAEGGNIYQYRLRVGIFNPAFTGSDDKAVFWTEFSSPTQTVDIPRMMYFFATNVHEAAKTATFNIFKYKNGYWRNQEFSRVGIGEAIGKLVENEEEQTTYVSSRGQLVTETTSNNDPAKNPDSIDFSTGNVLVDIITSEVTDPSGASSRKYSSVVYSPKGATTTSRMPVGAANWPEDMRKTYNWLLTQIGETREKESFKQWTVTTDRFTGQ